MSSFLVHAAQQHRGTEPKFMAQPNLLSKRDFNINQPLELRCPIEKPLSKELKIKHDRQDQLQ